MNFLLDTCTISDFFKNISSVVIHYKSVSPENIFISSVTVMEIEFGLKLNQDRAKKIQPIWKEFLKHIHIIPYTPQCAVFSATIRAQLKAKGLLIGPYDILLAGTALAHEMTLVTSNTDEFIRIPNLCLENWRN